MKNFDVIVVGGGIGGLVAGAMLARYGWRSLVCEAHTEPGGAAHGFSRQGFEFDTGPSFYSGLQDSSSLNPLRMVLDVLGESVQTVAYDPLGHYHFPEQTFPVFCDREAYIRAIANVTPVGAQEYAAFERQMLRLYNALRAIPALALRPDWQAIPLLLRHYPLALLKLVPQLPQIQGSAGDVLDRTVQDPWVRRLVDLECFLLSGLKAEGTVAPEVSFMLGERSRLGVDYPVGGSRAIVQALVRGLETWGGQLRLITPVQRICVEAGRVVGVELRGGDRLNAPVVISNASLWDTYTHLLQPQDLPETYRQHALQTPAVGSFMHLHLGFRASGLEGLTGHHVVVRNAEQDITAPGNTCMISIPSVWDPGLAPHGHHLLHAYTLEPFDGWQRDGDYPRRKQDRAEALYQAVERVIPDVRDRITLELIGTPLTHSQYLRRHRGTYGPAIAAHQGQFPPPQTPITGLYRVGDSTMPGIGIPAVAASGVLCANSLVSSRQIVDLLAVLKNQG